MMAFCTSQHCMCDGVASLWAYNHACRHRHVRRHAHRHVHRHVRRHVHSVCTGMCIDMCTHIRPPRGKWSKPVPPCPHTCAQHAVGDAGAPCRRRRRRAMPSATPVRHDVGDAGAPVPPGGSQRVASNEGRGGAVMMEWHRSGSLLVAAFDNGDVALLDSALQPVRPLVAHRPAGHNYTGHTHTGHSYTGHDCTYHNSIGHGHTGHHC